jgi:signal transduction histidine kinase
VKNYSELQEAHDKLNSLHDKLHQTVEELEHSNEDLLEENTERKKVESALAMANNKLQLMASITRHDLLNQLNSLQGYLDLALTDRMEDPDNAWVFVEKAHKIIDQTVNTVRFTDEYQNIGIKTPVWQNLRILIENSIRHTSLQEIRLDNLVSDIYEVFADPLIEKVFSNLVENSVKYGKKNTSIAFRLEKKGDGHAIICEDNGVGVPILEKSKIFTYQYGKNTGLGLFLSREILSITGISIIENGVEGKGARFEILCPMGTIRKGEAAKECKVEKFCSP